MSIVQTVEFYSFRQAFERMGRIDQFSYAGLRALFDYLEELSEDIAEPIELDVISLCCGYSEEHYKDIADNYDIDLSDANGDEDVELKIVLDYLHENTNVCGNDEATGNIVYNLP